MRYEFYTVLSILLAIVSPFSCSSAASDPPPKNVLETWPLKLQSKSTTYRLLHFPAKFKAKLRVECEKDGDVDLFVLDALGKVVARDTSPGKDCKVEFMTRDRADNWLVRIVNLGANNNAGTFKHNGEGIENMPIAPAEVPSGKTIGFYRFFEADKIAALHAEYESKTPIALSIYNVENVKIASDPKGRQVVWDVQSPNIYRVSLTNSSKDKVQCRFKTDTHVVKPMPLPAFDIAHQAKTTFHLDFPANKLAAIWVTSEKQTDIDLLVYDANGKEVASDITLGKDCFVGWMPKTAATYRVVVLNNGFGDNRCVLKHNGEVAKKP